MARFPDYAPEFRIEIDGAPIPPAMRGSVSRISFTSGIAGASRVEVTLANEQLQWLDHPLLDADLGFELHLGYAPDPLERVFVGEITGVNASFPNGGMPTVTIVAHDFLQRLTVGALTRKFAAPLPFIGDVPLPDAAVMSLVAASNLLIPAPDPIGAALDFFTLVATYSATTLEGNRGVRVQEQESDHDLLVRLAKENGWELFIDQTADPQGYVIRFMGFVQDYSPALSLTWGSSLAEFTPKFTTVGQVAGVQSTLWIPTLKMGFLIVLAWDFDRAAFDFRIMPDLGELTGYTAPGGLLKVDSSSPAMLPKKLLSELLPRLNNRLTGSGSAVGNLAIGAGKVIDLKGLGEQFSGLYRITSATHSIDSGGFRTSFDARKEIWFGSIPVPKGAGGLLSVNGNRIG
jgi:hypothetical protein